MKTRDLTGDQVFRIADQGVDPTRELDLISNIEKYVTDAHAFATAYASYAQAVYELCSGMPEPVSRFLLRWPHRKPELI